MIWLISIQNTAQLSTLIDKSVKIHPAIFPKLQFSGHGQRCPNCHRLTIDLPQIHGTIYTGHGLGYSRCRNLFLALVQKITYCITKKRGPLVKKCFWCCLEIGPGWNTYKYHFSVKTQFLYVQFILFRIKTWKKKKSPGWNTYTHQILMDEFSINRSSSRPGVLPIRVKWCEISCA